MAILSCTMDPTYGRSGYHNFTALCDAPLTKEEASKKQEAMGYHPAGYGFYSFAGAKKGDTYVYTWECANSCD